VEIEIRAGFCDPDGELVAVLDRPDWQRVNIRRPMKVKGLGKTISRVGSVVWAGRAGSRSLPVSAVRQTMRGVGAVFAGICVAITVAGVVGVGTSG
jgi:hypothetical protein